MNTTSRLTIPIDTNLRTRLSQRATDLGFDSSQALLRYVSKAIVDGREVTFGQADQVGDGWGSPPAHVVERWRNDIAELEADRKAGNLKSFTNADEALAHLNSL